MFTHFLLPYIYVFIKCILYIVLYFYTLCMLYIMLCCRPKNVMRYLIDTLYTFMSVHLHRNLRNYFSIISCINLKVYSHQADQQKVQFKLFLYIKRHFMFQFQGTEHIFQVFSIQRLLTI